MKYVGLLSFKPGILQNPIKKIKIFNFVNYISELPI